jgi:hypothetical protein
VALVRWPAGNLGDQLPQPLVRRIRVESLVPQECEPRSGIVAMKSVSATTNGRSCIRQLPSSMALPGERGVVPNRLSGLPQIAGQ